MMVLMVQYDSDTYFEALLVEEYSEGRKTYFIDIIAKLKSTRSSQKNNVIVGVIFEYDRDD